MSDTPEQNARVEAAARAIHRFDAGCRDDACDAWECYVTQAKLVLAAADGVSQNTAALIAVRVECRACGDIVELPELDGRVSITPLDGWECSLETGWRCPKHRNREKGRSNV